MTSNYTEKRSVCDIAVSFTKLQNVLNVPCTSLRRSIWY